jgi:hypothetical protein
MSAAEAQKSTSTREDSGVSRGFFQARNAVKAEANDLALDKLRRLPPVPDPQTLRSGDDVRKKREEWYGGKPEVDNLASSWLHLRQRAVRQLRHRPHL